MRNREFENIWDNEVKQLFSNCINSDLVGLIYKANDGTITEKEKLKLVEFKREYTDILAVFHISQTGWKIEHSLADGREYAAEIAAYELYSVISDDQYWYDIFKDKMETEQAKNILKLRDGLEKLINVMSL